VLDVGPGAALAPSWLADARRSVRLEAPEERLEEVGERIGIAEDPVHLVFVDRPKSSGPSSDVNVPTACGR